MMTELLFGIGAGIGATLVAFTGVVAMKDVYREAFLAGRTAGLKQGEAHLRTRAEVTATLAPEGSLSYANLRALAFQQAASDLAEIRRAP